MKGLRSAMSDDEFAKLEHLAQALGVSVEELVKRSLVAYVAQAKAETAFEPIGFGMWADRPEMRDEAKWVAWLRRRERRDTMSVQLEQIYQQTQTLSWPERLELISRMCADLKADTELQEELSQWDRLSDEALAQFEQRL